MEFPTELLLDDDCIGGGGGGIIVVDGSSGIRNGGSEVESPSFSVGNGSGSTPPPRQRAGREREPARSVKVELRENLGYLREGRLTKSCKNKVRY